MIRYSTNRCPPARRAAARGRGRAGHRHGGHRHRHRRRRRADRAVGRRRRARLLRLDPERQAQPHAVRGRARRDRGPRRGDPRRPRERQRRHLARARSPAAPQGYPGCQGLELHQNPAAVDKLADCLRLAARQYRRGPDAPDRQRCRDRHQLRRGAAARPPSTCRRTRRDRRSSSSPTASTTSRASPPATCSRRRNACSATGPRSRSCPSAWASIPSERGALRSGLEDLYGLTHDMDALPRRPGLRVGQRGVRERGRRRSRGGRRARAGDLLVHGRAEPHAEADAHARSRRTRPAPSATSRRTAGDGFIDLSWAEPADAGTKPVDTYQARCRADGSADWLPTQELPATEHEAVVDDVDNGTELRLRGRRHQRGRPGALDARRRVRDAGRPPRRSRRRQRGSRRSIGGRLGRRRIGRRLADRRLPLRVQRRRRRDLAAGQRARLGLDLDPGHRPRERHRVHLPRRRPRTPPGVSAVSPASNPFVAVRRSRSTATRSSAGSWAASSPPPRSPRPGTSSGGIATACGRTSPPTSTIPRPSRSAAGRARASRSSATRSRWTGAGTRTSRSSTRARSVRRPVGRRPHRRQGRRRRRGHRSGRRIPHT